MVIAGRSVIELLKIGSLPSFDPTDHEVLNRNLSEWSPRRILEALGPANEESETLIRLIVACAIIEGPQRIEELILQIDRLLAGHHQHLRAKLKDKMYRELGAGMKDLLAVIDPPRQPLQTVKARVANVIADAGASFTDFDLDIILYYGRLCIASYLVATSRNVVAAKDMLTIFSKPPSLLDANAWKERFLTEKESARALLFEPKDYKRVVVVLNDGLLMYDPARSSVASG